MWKFHIFHLTQILREIKIGNFRSSKNALLTLSQALNLNIGKFLKYFRVEFFPKQNSEPPENVKMAVFEAPNLPKLISRKI